MKNFSTKPTDENVKQSLVEDSLGRKEELRRFVELLNAINESCSIALNGDWGSGKTFFVKQAKLLVDCLNLDCKIEGKQQILKLYKMEEYNCSVATVYYDAWINDNNEDPILSLVHSAIEGKQAVFNAGKRSALFSAGIAIMNFFADGRITSVMEAYEKARGENPLELPQKVVNIHELLHEFIDALIEEKGNRLIFFIDELDRCKPSYAVQVLERIKHYFDDDRVTFVFSVNLTQLQHTIRNYYGSEFDAIRYLDKFFDLRVSVSDIDYERFFAHLKFNTRYFNYNEKCAQVAKQLRFSLREVERYLGLTRIVDYAAQGKEFLNTPKDLGERFLYLYVVPLLIGLSMSDAVAYSDFINGRNYSHLVELWSNSERVMVEAMLDEGKIEKIYLAVFGPERPFMERKVTVEKMEFTTEMKHKVLKTVSLLSLDADYAFK
jgi:KAP family P-loop domain.